MQFVMNTGRMHRNDQSDQSGIKVHKDIVNCTLCVWMYFVYPTFSGSDAQKNEYWNGLGYFYCMNSSILQYFCFKVRKTLLFLSKL